MDGGFPVWKLQTSDQRPGPYVPLNPRTRQYTVMADGSATEGVKDVVNAALFINS